MKKFLKETNHIKKSLILLAVILLMLIGGFIIKWSLSKHSAYDTLSSNPSFAEHHCTDEIPQGDGFLYGTLDAGFSRGLIRALDSAGARLYGNIVCPSVRQQIRFLGIPTDLVSQRHLDTVHMDCRTEEAMEKARQWDTHPGYHVPSNFPYADTQKCLDANVELYPTWIFKDGSRLVGVQLPHVLAKKIGF